MKARNLLSGVAMTAYIAPALAHAFLAQANPGAGAALARAPAEIRLLFSEKLEPVFSGVTVIDAAGDDVETASPVVQGASIRVALKPLGPGVYRVAWRAVSVDTHRTEGTYSFTVKP